MDNINITPETTEEMWKFGDGSLKDIYSMDIIEVYTCAIHALKRMRHWTKQALFYDYKIKTTYDDKKQLEKHQYQKTRANNNKFIFAEKLNALDQRSKDLSDPLPDSFEEIKQRLTQLKKESEHEDKS